MALRRNFDPDSDSSSGSMVHSMTKTADRLEDAANAFLKAIECRNDLYQAHYNLGIIRVEQNRFDDAAASFRTALSYNPKFLEAINNLGVTYDLQGKKRLAKKAYRKVLTLKSSSVDHLYIKSSALLNLGKITKAIKAFEEAVSYAPELLNAHANLRHTIREYQNRSSAETFQSRYVKKISPFKRDRQWKVFISDNGQISSQLDQAEESANAFIKAIELNDNLYQAHYNLGIIRLGQGCFYEAINCFKKSLSLNPSMIESLNNLGIAYHYTGQPFKAKAAFRKILAANPDSPHTAYIHAGAYRNLGKVKQALKVYDTATLNAPELTDYYANLKRILDQDASRLQQLEETFSSFIALRQFTKNLVPASLNSNQWKDFIPASPFSLPQYQRPMVIAGTGLAAAAIMHYSLIQHDVDQGRDFKDTELGILTSDDITIREIAIKPSETPISLSDTAIASTSHTPSKLKEKLETTVIKEETIILETEKATNVASNPTNNTSHRHIDGITLNSQDYSIFTNNCAKIGTNLIRDFISNEFKKKNTSGSNSGIIQIPTPLHLFPSYMASLNQQAWDRPYNLKLGPVTFQFDAVGKLAYNDNVGLSSARKKSDFILTGNLIVNGAWPITDLNTLSLNLSLGLSKYHRNTELDTKHILIDPGSDSKMEVVVLIDAFTITGYNTVSMTDDPFTVAALSNFERFTRFKNKTGVNVLWDLSDVKISGDIGRESFLVMDTAPLDHLDRTTDTLSLHATAKYKPWLDLGAKATASYISYHDDRRSRSESVSFGPTASAKLTDFIEVGGELMFQRNKYASSNSSNIDNHGISFDWKHQLNDRMDYALIYSSSLNTAIGQGSNFSRNKNYSFIFNWKASDVLDVSTKLTYLTGDEENSPKFERTSFTIDAIYDLQPNIDLIFSASNSVKKSDDAPESDYARNMLSATINYEF